MSTLVLLPLTGLKTALIVGAALDLLLALYLFLRSGLSLPRQLGASLAAALVLLLAVLSPRFDEARMASGIFRGTPEAMNAERTVLLHRDGRTATVAVVKTGSFLSIMTNGKPDASISLEPGKSTFDEPTMALLGGLPQMLNPRIESAAVIGMGAGVSADIMLTDKSLRYLDVIEIEAGMVEGARLFGAASARVFRRMPSRASS